MPKRMQDENPRLWAKIVADHERKEAKKKKVKTIRAVTKSPGITTEHDYAHGSMEQWDMSVFDNAVGFSVVRRTTRTDHDNFESAMTDVMTAPGLIYAITATGRSTCIEKKHWEHCLQRWRTKH